MRCVNMTADGDFEARVPHLDIPMVFRFRDREVRATPKLDTLIVEPTAGRLICPSGGRASRSAGS